MTPRPNVTFLSPASVLGSAAIKSLAGETMAAEPEVQVSHFLDQYGGFGSFHYKLLFWSVLDRLSWTATTLGPLPSPRQASSRNGTSRRKNSASC